MIHHSQMLPQTQSLTTHLWPSLPLSKSTALTHSSLPRTTPFRKSLFKTLQCSVSVASEPAHLDTVRNKPFPAEVSRTIVELCSVATLSALARDGWPLGVGVRFAVDPQGTPVLCLNSSHTHFSIDRRCSLHVQLEQCRARTQQCTIQGSIHKPEDRMALKKFHSAWEKRFGEVVDENLLHFVSVERVLQMEDFHEVGMWVTSSDYKTANPDPLRDFAEMFVEEINTSNMEDILRFCSIYVDLDFQALEAKLIWVDRLGFDMHIYSSSKDIFEVRIPFPREVTDEKGAKSSFNSMAQLAWEVEKNYNAPDFKKVKQLRKIT